MTRDEAVVILKGRLKRTADSGIDANIVREMQVVQRDKLERSAVLPWFLLSEETDLDLTANATTVDLPPNFLREWEEWNPFLVRTDTVPIVKYPLTRLAADSAIKILDPSSSTFIGTPTAGQVPKVYSLLGSQYMLQPAVPDDGHTYKLRLRYWQRAAPLTTDIENIWLVWASDLLMAETGAVIAGFYLRDPGAKEDMANAAKAAWEDLWRAHEAWVNSNDSAIMEYGQGST